MQAGFQHGGVVVRWSGSGKLRREAPGTRGEESTSSALRAGSCPRGTIVSVGSGVLEVSASVVGPKRARRLAAAAAVAPIGLRSPPSSGWGQPTAGPPGLLREGASVGARPAQAGPAALGARSASDALRVIAACSSSYAFPPGVDLLRQGGPPAFVFVVADGLVKLSRGEPDGRTATISLRRPGWPLGAAAVVLGEPYVATATTVTRCTVHQVPADLFCQLLQTRPEVSWYLHAIHGQEVHEQALRIADLTCASARCRLERLLVDLATAAGHSRAGTEYRLQLPLRHWEIAQLIGVTPPYFSELLKELEVEGVLRRHKGCLVLAPPVSSPARGRL